MTMTMREDAARICQAMPEPFTPTSTISSELGQQIGLLKLELGRLYCLRFPIKGK